MTCDLGGQSIKILGDFFVKFLSRDVVIGPESIATGDFSCGVDGCESKGFQ
jgi:hypothetical protein